MSWPEAQDLRTFSPSVGDRPAPPSPSPSGTDFVLVIAALTAGILAGWYLGVRHAVRSLPVSTDAPENADGQDEPDWVLMRDGYELPGTRFCPVCLAEYIAGTQTCEDCGVELVEDYEVPQNDPPIKQDIIRVFRTGSWITLQFVQQYLAANRIPSSATRNSFCGDIIEVDLYVFESDALRSKKLIRQYLAGVEESFA